MLDLANTPGLTPKCHFAQSLLPSFVNHEQPSTKRKPFSTILDKISVHTLDLIVPTSTAEKLQSSLSAESKTPCYARVHMKPLELIEGDFFNHYIKSGNILMLAAGRADIDSTFSLHEGVLRIEVDKATHERMGLQGVAIQDDYGRKHKKTRYAIEVNFRLPSMLAGHKAFERVKWAFKNVLIHSMTWLMYDLKSPILPEAIGPLAEFHPVLRELKAAHQDLGACSLPAYFSDSSAVDHEAAGEILEWLSLVSADSSRVLKSDAIDPHLSRYSVPSRSASAKTQSLSRLHWHGLIPSAFVTKILLAVLRASGEEWFALAATSFNQESYTILRDKERVLTWEYAD